MSEPSASSIPDESGERKEVRWEEVATASGITAAQIIVGRLQSEGIPARAWQEGAGQATGLVVGLLGTAHVLVPEDFADSAREILDEGNKYLEDVNEE